MRVCILSDYDGRLDEGMRNIAYYLGREISKHNEVLHLCLLPHSNLAKLSFWAKIHRFGPDIIHFVPGSTIWTFLFAKLLRVAYPKARIVMSVPHPTLSPRSLKLIPLLKPNLVLAQSRESLQLFESIGYRTKLLLNGVDVRKFLPTTPEDKHKLRVKYQVPLDKTVVLHVGPIERGRNMLLLAPFQKEVDVQVVVVGSVSAPAEEDVYHRLVASGCLVWRQYFPDIAEVYGMADCYVFPVVQKRNCVEFPLSVLEAAACDLPIIATRFGALPAVLSPGDGLYFVDSDGELLPTFRRARANSCPVNTRAKALKHSWEEVGRELEEIYRKLTSEVL